MAVAKYQPKSLSVQPGQIPVRVTAAAIDGLYACVTHWTEPMIDGGWHAMTRRSASVFLRWCREHSAACRDEPLPRGQRLAMRRLAEQLESKL